MPKTSGVPAPKLALYEKLVAAHGKAKRKGAKIPYTSRNGHMFSFLTQTGALALRLPQDEREEFLKKYRTKLAVQYGAVMKEYAMVPAALLSKTRELVKYFALSYDYVGSLEPKPTTRKPPKAAKKKTAKKAAKKKTKKTAKKKTGKKTGTKAKKKSSGKAKRKTGKKARKKTGTKAKTKTGRKAKRKTGTKAKGKTGRKRN